MAEDTSVSVARWQQDKQTAAGLVFLFYPLYPVSSVETSHFNDVTDALSMGTGDILGRFNYLL